MAEREPTPDLEGPRPDGWKNNHWLAAEALHNGATVAEAANLAGVRPRTVKAWRQAWRDRFGSDFLPSNPGNPDPVEARAANLENWAERRKEAGAQFGSASIAATSVIAGRLQAMLERPEDWTPAELDKLASVALRLATLADMLTGHGKGQVLVDPAVPPGTLDGLTAPRSPDEHRGLLEQTELVIASYRRRSGAIETTEAE